MPFGRSERGGGGTSVSSVSSGSGIPSFPSAPSVSTHNSAPGLLVAPLASPDSA